MIRVAIYNIGTGIVDRLCACPENHAEMQCREGEAFFQLSDNQNVEDGRDYIENGELKRLKDMQLNVTSKFAHVRIDGIPKGSAVKVMGQSVAVGDGFLELDAPQGSRLTLRVDPPQPWMPESREVTVQ